MLLNQTNNKTEFFLIANRNVSAALPEISLKLGELSIQRSTSIKNLGITFDDSLTMYSQINTICKSVNFHIRNIWRICRFITTEACHHIVRGLVLSHLDYANSLLFGVRETDLTCLQHLQNKAARSVMSCGRDQSSTDLLRELHWLPVKQRTIYKLRMYIYKALNDMAPCYISAMTHLQNTDPAEYRQWLRSSSDQTRLIVSRSFKRAGDMSFTIAAARSGMTFLFIYVNRSPCLCSRGSWKLTCFHNFCSLFFHSFSFVKCSVLRGALNKCFGNNKIIIIIITWSWR